MTLIVILNAALAIGIVGVILALHARAIIADHHQHHGSESLWASRPQPTPAVVQAPHHAPRPTRTPAAGRRAPAMVTD